MHSYTGNDRPYVYVCYSDKDSEVNSFLNALDEDNIALCLNGNEKQISAAYGVLIFLSNNLLQDDKLARTIETAIKHNINILSVHLEDVELSDTLKMQLNSQQALLYDPNRSSEDLLKEMKKSVIFNDMQITKQQKDNQKKRVLFTSIGIIAAVVLLFVFVILPLLKTPEPADEYDPLEQFGLAGLSEEDLAKITSLHVVGDTVISDPATVRSINIDNSQTDGRLHYTILREYEVAMGVSDEEYGVALNGSISDISALSSLPNLKRLTLAGQNISDISVLSQMSNLSILNISNNPITSLEGLQNCEKLSIVNLADLPVSDLSPLFVTGKLKELDLSGCRNVNDLSGIENTNITFLSTAGTAIRHIDHLPSIYSFGINDLSLILDPLDSYSFLADNTAYRNIILNGASPSSFIPYLEKARIAELQLNDCGIERISQLEGLSVNSTLQINDENFSSLEGVDEFFPYLGTLDISGSDALNDLSALLESNISKLIISNEQRELISDSILEKGIEVLIRLEDELVPYEQS